MSDMKDKEPMIVFLDYDSTLTTESTLPWIASIKTFPNIHPDLQPLSAAYSADLHAYDTSDHFKDARTSVLEYELALLDGMKTIESASLDRVQAAGIFAGLEGKSGLQSITRVACDAVKCKKVVFRKGWYEFIRSVQADGGKVVIISVAWSAAFIRASMMEAGLSVANSRCKHARQAIDDIEIFANEIALDGSGKIKGVWPDDRDQLILTATDKSDTLKLYLQRQREQSCGASPDSDIRHTTVYIGDSGTDLACLLQVDIGVCIRDHGLSSEQRGLHAIINRLGMIVPWNGDSFQSINELSLIWISDFDELLQYGWHFESAINSTSTRE